MNTKEMTDKLHTFERNVYLGVAGLAGAGAVALVTNWQEEFDKLAGVSEEFAKQTNAQAVTESAYENISQALTSLQEAVVEGSAAAIQSAGTHFYEVLAASHVSLWEVLDTVKGGSTPPTDVQSIRVIEILSKAFS